MNKLNSFQIMFHLFSVSITKRDILYDINRFLPLGAPVIKEEELQKQTVIAGEDIFLPVKFESCSPPSITWTLDDKELSASDRISLVEREGYTEVNIEQAQKSDAGTYKVILSNRAGEAHISFIVDVHGNCLRFCVIIKKRETQRLKYVLS